MSESVKRSPMKTITHRRPNSKLGHPNVVVGYQELDGLLLAMSSIWGWWRSVNCAAIRQLGHPNGGVGQCVDQ